MAKYVVKEEVFVFSVILKELTEFSRVAFLLGLGFSTFWVYSLLISYARNKERR